MTVRWLAWLAVLALSGCADPTPPNAWTPGDSAGAWHVTDADPWAAFSSGCGFCLGDPDVPEFALVAVYRDHKVLHISYAVGTGRDVEFAATAPPGPRIEVEELLSVLGPIYGEDGRGVRVHDVRTATLNHRDWSQVEDVLHWSLDRAKEPPHGQADCLDCGGFLLTAWSPPATLDLEINGGDQDPGPALALAVQQLMLLGQWASSPT